MWHLRWTVEFFRCQEGRQCLKLSGKGQFPWTMDKIKVHIPSWLKYICKLLCKGRHWKLVPFHELVERTQIHREPRLYLTQFQDMQESWLPRRGWICVDKSILYQRGNKLCHELIFRGRIVTDFHAHELSVESEVNCQRFNLCRSWWKGRAEDCKVVSVELYQIFSVFFRKEFSTCAV